MNQLVNILGKRQSAVYKHMALLRDRGALRWRPAECGTLIVSFPDSFNEPNGVFEENSQCTENNSINLESFSKLMESPVFKLNQESNLNEEDNKNTAFQESGKHPNSKETSSLSIKPTSIYKAITNLTPNAQQRNLLAAKVTDLDLWRASLQHWLFHGWNPRNVLGMLNLYAQGGPAACGFCRPKRKPASKPILGDQSAQRERDRLEARRRIAEARAKRAAREQAESQVADAPAESALHEPPTDPI
jgi:hypothetical protein